MNKLILIVVSFLFGLNSYCKEQESPLIINILGTVEVDNSTEISKQILEYDTKMLYKETGEPLRIKINSYGGSVYCALGIVDAMTFCDTPIATECLDTAASSAAIILCMGTKGHRYAHKNSRILIHYAKITDKDIDQISEQDFKELNTVNEEMLTLLSKNSNLSKEELVKTIEEANGELWLSAEEALSYGLIDEILE